MSKLLPIKLLPKFEFLMQRSSTNLFIAAAIRKEGRLVRVDTKGRAKNFRAGRR